MWRLFATIQTKTCVFWDSLSHKCCLVFAATVTINPMTIATFNPFDEYSMAKYLWAMIWHLKITTFWALTSQNLSSSLELTQINFLGLNLLSSIVARVGKLLCVNTNIAHRVCVYHAFVSQLQYNFCHKSSIDHLFGSRITDENSKCGEALPGYRFNLLDLLKSSEIFEIIQIRWHRARRIIAVKKIETSLYKSQSITSMWLKGAWITLKCMHALTRLWS